ncbi:MAG: hypothetical protein ACRDE5_17095 [Ginsengibacter sp.]
MTLEKKPVFNQRELYDPSLSIINSVPQLIAYADSVAYKHQLRTGTLQYAELVSFIIRRRFYHGFSNYTLNQNWIAATAQYFFGMGLACPVNPDEILQYPCAGCSQQAIVLMEAMKRKSISYRSVGFPHHYATELSFNNSWYFFDPDMEPSIPESDRIETSWNASSDSLKKYYVLDSRKLLDWGFGKSLKVKVGDTNAAPAPRAYFFQLVTKYLSRISWLFPLIFFYQQKRNNSKIQEG